MFGGQQAHSNHGGRVEDGVSATKKESDGWFDVASVILNLHETITKP